jgi:hypothetical protein
LADKRLFQHHQDSLFDICSDFTLARTYSNIQTKKPDFIKANGGSFFSLSPKNAKHSIQINLNTKNLHTTELDFKTSFLADNIAILVGYGILFLFVWITMFIPIIGVLFVFVFLITLITHLPWWLYSRNKIKKEFWSYIESKVQTLQTSNQQNIFQTNTPKEPRLPSNDETSIYGPNSQPNSTPNTTKRCSKCKTPIRQGLRFCPSCGTFIP